MEESGDKGWGGAEIMGLWGVRLYGEREGVEKVFGDGKRANSK